MELSPALLGLALVVLALALLVFEQYVMGREIEATEIIMYLLETGIMLIAFEYGLITR